jgi:hypothetical protein
MKDREFMISNHVITGMVKILKRDGKDLSVHKKAVSDGDIHKLYTRGDFNIDNPITLQNKVFGDVMLNFGRRGQEGLQELKKSSYAKFLDDKGSVYYKITDSEADKTHHGMDSRKTNKDVRMYATPRDRTCPVASLELYLSKLHPECDAFFQQPLGHPKVNIWYAKQPIGKNKLAHIMSRISTEANLSKRYTNHCIGATVAINLKRVGVDLLSIMSVTGHRNVKSLESYVQEQSDHENRQLSASLQRIGIGSEHSGQLAPVSTASQSPLAGVVTCSTSLMNNVSVSNTTVTATRNPLTDFNFFTNTSISGGTFTINFISKDNA